MLNDAYAEFASRHPDRISSYVMLPLPHIDAALKEMERGFDQLGCVGVNMNIICLNRSVAVVAAGSTGNAGNPGPAGFTNDVMDPFVTLSAAAAVTKQLKLGTGVCLVIQRDTKGQQ